MLKTINNTSDKSTQKPLLIAGPCSAETREQVLNTAIAVKNSGATIFRAGIWKPRTRPGAFEGVGIIGLEWLQQVQSEVKLAVATEVANTQHVEAALKAGIDVLWIGARTTANPFAVQEIADALQGSNIPVLVKNPVSYDVGLWVGALERLQQRGITELGAIHRGISPIRKGIYRNNPEWAMVKELKKHFPDITYISDPSHIGGSRELIEPLSKTALDLGMDGLMIEAHITPDNAWSDAEQQITPDVLKRIYDSLLQNSANSSKSNTGIDNLRTNIDLIDSEIIDLLSERMSMSTDIAVLKQLENMSVLQEDRWNTLLDNCIKKGLSKNLTSEFIVKIYEAVHEASIAKQHQTLIKL